MHLTQIPDLFYSVTVQINLLYIHLHRLVRNVRLIATFLPEPTVLPGGNGQMTSEPEKKEKQR